MVQGTVCAKVSGSLGTAVETLRLVPKGLPEALWAPVYRSGDRWFRTGDFSADLCPGPSVDGTPTPLLPVFGVYFLRREGVSHSLTFLYTQDKVRNA